MDFEEAWKNRPWWGANTPDKERAKYWFSLGQESDPGEPAVLPPVPMALADFNSVMGGDIKPEDMPMESFLLIQRLLTEHYATQQAVDVEAVKADKVDFVYNGVSGHGTSIDDIARQFIDLLHATGRWMVPKGKENETDIV